MGGRPSRCPLEHPRNFNHPKRTDMNSNTAAEYHNLPLNVLIQSAAEPRL